MKFCSFKSYSTFVPLQESFGRWIICRADAPHTAWSGRRWVAITGDVQISNFASREEAIAYAQGFGMELAANRELPPAGPEVAA